MKLNLILFSAAIFGIQHVIAGPYPSASASASINVSGSASYSKGKSISNSLKAVPAASSSLAVATALPTTNLTPNPNGIITVDPQLVQELGWSQKDTDVLTGFLDAIDRLGDLSNHAFDVTTQKLLNDFQTEARELIASSGYKYQPSTDGTHRRILSRMSTEEAAEKGIYTPQSIPDVIEKLVQGLTNLVNKLKKSADGGSVIAQKIYTIVNNILTSIGKTIEDHLFPKSKSADPANPANPANPAMHLPTFLQ